jgi:hypothetical protein
VADAFRATLGIDVAAAVVTSEPVGVSTFLSPSGASWGSVQNTNTLVEGAQELLRLGCDAVAVVARFPEDEEDEEDQGLFQAYRQGLGVDAIAGAEALISHVISKRLMVPCAHAPAFAPSELFSQTTPKACAEELGYTFLPCVLAYLHKAPRLLPLPQPQAQAQAQVGAGGGGLVAKDVDCVVAPAGALGGAAVLALIGRHTHNTQGQGQGQGQGQASKRGLLLISVDDNASNMRATPRALGLDVDLDPSTPGPGPGVTVVHARSYAEAVGLMAAHKNGILLPSIGATVSPLSLTRL